MPHPWGELILKSPKENGVSSKENGVSSKENGVSSFFLVEFIEASRCIERCRAKAVASSNGLL
jgi:hypothetical protein